MRVLLFLILLPTLSQAAIKFKQDSKNTYSIHGHKIIFVTDTEMAITVSDNCVKKQNVDCEAIQALKRLKGLQLEESLLQGGANPGAVACFHEKVKGQSVLGTDFQGNQNCFCHFKKDNSYVDCGTLTAYVRKK